MKFYVQHGGKELVFPSFRDFQSMYRLKFVGPDDLVRRENSERWVRAGDLPELRTIHLYERQGGTWSLHLFLLILLGSVAFGVMGQFFFSKSAPVFDSPAPKAAAKPPDAVPAVVPPAVPAPPPPSAP